MLNKTVQDAINEQIKHEFYSAYLYLSMSAYCETINLPGFAHWMRLQHQEELAHAMKFFDFINDREGSVELQAIDQPPADEATLVLDDGRRPWLSEGRAQDQQLVRGEPQGRGVRRQVEGVQRRRGRHEATSADRLRRAHANPPGRRTVAG